MTHSIATPFRLMLLLAIGLTLQLNAATAKDILGEWSIDVNASLEEMNKSPRAATFPPGSFEGMKKAFAQAMNKMTINITADKIVRSMDADKKGESSYKVLGIEGDTIVTETTDADGKVLKTNFTVNADTLEMIKDSEHGMPFVFKRVAAK